jgi:DNA primase
MSTPVEELKAIPILDVAKRLDLEVHGTRMHCFNRRHEDRKTPSLHFNVAENYFNCFGCEIGGSTIDLVMAASGCTSKRAMQWLEQEFGLSRPAASVTRLRLRAHTRRSSPQVRQTSPKLKADSEVYNWFLEKAELPRMAREYLLKRGLSTQTISHFRLGGSLDPRALACIIHDC